MELKEKKIGDAEQKIFPELPNRDFQEKKQKKMLVQD